MKDDNTSGGPESTGADGADPPGTERSAEGLRIKPMSKQEAAEVERREREFGERRPVVVCGVVAEARRELPHSVDAFLRFMTDRGIQRDQLVRALRDGGFRPSELLGETEVLAGQYVKWVLRGHSEPVGPADRSLREAFAAYDGPTPVSPPLVHDEAPPSACGTSTATDNAEASRDEVSVPSHDAESAGTENLEDDLAQIEDELGDRNTAEAPEAPAECAPGVSPATSEAARSSSPVEQASPSRPAGEPTFQQGLKATIERFDMLLCEDALVQNPIQNWLIRDIWRVGGVGFVTGPAKNWKSSLGVDMAASVASGTEFLGKFACLNPGPTLYVSMERDSASVPPRLKAVFDHRGVPISDRNVVVRGTKRVTLDVVETRLWFRELLREVRPRLVVIDTLVQVGGLRTETAFGPMNSLLQYFQVLATEFATAIAVVHHADDKGTRLRGSRCMEGWWSTRLTLTREQGGGTLRVQHSDAGDLDPIYLGLVNHGGGHHLEVIGTAAEGHDPLERRIRSYLLNAPGISRNKLALAIGGSRQAVWDKVRELSMGESPLVREEQKRLYWVDPPEPPIEDPENGRVAQIVQMLG